MAKLKPNSQPLRNPGQSIDEEIERVIHDEFLTYIVLALILWVMAAFEWAAKALHWPRLPGIYVIFAYSTDRERDFHMIVNTSVERLTGHRCFT